MKGYNMQTKGLVVVSLLMLASGARGNPPVTITFDPPALPGGQKVIYSWIEKDYIFTPPGDMASNDAYSPGYPWDGTAYIQVDPLPMTIRRDDLLPFGFLSVDLAEYSTLFPLPVSVTFTGTRMDQSTTAVTFTTDGIIDGNGPLQDFQTFFFPASFTDLQLVTVTADWAASLDYSMDNLQVQIVPEPGLLGLSCLALLLWAYHRARKCLTSVPEATAG
jgi:hypothetical protein